MPPRLGKQSSSVGESVNNVVHILLEPADSALLALDMLAEPAQRLELTQGRRAECFLTQYLASSYIRGSATELAK